MKKRTRILCAVVAVFLAFQGYYAFYYGYTYEKPYYSPNQAFYYQKYRLFSWSRWIPSVGMPGDGAQSLYNTGGYVRVFRADGTLEGQFYNNCVAMTEVHWTGDSIVGFGCDESGDNLVELSADGG